MKTSFRDLFLWSFTIPSTTSMNSPVKSGLGLKSERLETTLSTKFFLQCNGRIIGIATVSRPYSEASDRAERTAWCSKGLLILFALLLWSAYGRKIRLSASKPYPLVITAFPISQYPIAASSSNKLAPAFRITF